MVRLISRSPWDGQPVWDGAADDPTAIDPMELHGQMPLPMPDVHAGLTTLAEVLTRRRHEAIDLLIREAGKVRADAEAEVDLLPKKIAISVGPGLARTPVADAPIRWRPRGVALVLGPFNFPLHLLHGLVVPALAVGCPVIAKPSERTPALGAWYRDRITEAGLDPWCRVMLGGPQLVPPLLRHPAVMTIAAVGSHAMGQALTRLAADRPELVVALELGGVNHALLCDDADLASAAPVLADGAWRMAGQRCTATRIVHVPHAHSDDLVERLRAEHRTWTYGVDARLGPLISPGERERFCASQQPAPGFHLLAGDPQAHLGTARCDPLLWSATTEAVRHPRLTEEHFGPALIVCPYTDEADALRQMMDNRWRLAAAVWTTDQDRFRHLANHLAYGQVSRNRSTAGARSDLPFGGCGLSGNGRPAALAAGAIFADETVVLE